MKILGVDASSKTIACALLEGTTKEDCILLQYNYFQPNPKDNILNKLKSIKEHFSQLLKIWDVPNSIYIEDIILHMQGGSTAQTITTLAAINRMMGLALYEMYNIEPNLISVLSVRHKLKLDKKLPPKEDMPKLLEHHLINFKFPWVTELKGRGKKKQEVISNISYDISDAMATGLAGMFIEFSK